MNAIVMVNRIRELKAVTLQTGGHQTRKDGMCAMEAVAWIVDGPHTDAPECVCLIIGAYVRRLNDIMPDDRRQKLKLVLPSLVNSAGSKALELKRAFKITDVSIRTWFPIYFERIDRMDIANGLRNLAPIVDSESARAARAALDARAALAALDARIWDSSIELIEELVAMRD